MYRRAFYSGSNRPTSLHLSVCDDGSVAVELKVISPERLVAKVWRDSLHWGNSILHQEVEILLYLNRSGFKNAPEYVSTVFTTRKTTVLSHFIMR